MKTARPRRIAALLAALLAAPAAPASAQAVSNDLPLNNGGDVVLSFSSPSVGSSLGGPGGPVLGDLFWKAYPGDRLLAIEQGSPPAATMEIDGFFEVLFDSDWSTPPDFYDRVIGPAAPSALAPCALEPAFLQQGLTTETVVSLGPSGLGNPCTVAPSLCSPSGGSCPVPPGFANGWILDVTLGSQPGSGVVLPADGTSASDAAVTYLLPGGMTLTGGPCGFGDYVYQAEYSQDETQADDCSGLSSFSGFHVPATGATPDAVTDTPSIHVSFRDPILNVRADSATGLGVEASDNGGGALNGLKLDTSPGGTEIVLEIRDQASAGLLARGWYATEPLAAGLPVLGTHLLIDPKPWKATAIGTVDPVVFFFTSEAAYVTAPMRVDAMSREIDLWMQALIYDPASGTARSTNRVRTTLF